MAFFKRARLYRDLTDSMARIITDHEDRIEALERCHSCTKKRRHRRPEEA